MDKNNWKSDTLRYDIASQEEGLPSSETTQMNLEDIVASTTTQAHKTNTTYFTCT